jgi:hypothetical protein
MTSQLSDGDEQLMRDLAEVLQDTGAAFGWPRIDVELEFARLVYDSRLNAELVLRSQPGDLYRTVFFEASSAAVQLERNADALVGQVIPAAGGDLSVIASGGEVFQIRTDDLGCFAIEDVPAEPFRLRWRTPTVDIVTDWIRL